MWEREKNFVRLVPSNRMPGREEVAIIVQGPMRKGLSGAPVPLFTQAHPVPEPDEVKSLFDAIRIGA